MSCTHRARIWQEIKFVRQPVFLQIMHVLYIIRATLIQTPLGPGTGMPQYTQYSF